MSTVEPIWCICILVEGCHMHRMDASMVKAGDDGFLGRKSAGIPAANEGQVGVGRDAHVVPQFLKLIEHTPRRLQAVSGFPPGGRFSTW